MEQSTKDNGKEITDGVKASKYGKTVQSTSALGVRILLAERAV